MKISSAFPSNFLRVADLLPHRLVPVIIDVVQVEDVGGSGQPGDEKPVLYFLHKEKGLVLNKTNAHTIADAYGDETNDWHGKPIVLHTTKTQFGGRMVDCIRIQIPDESMRRELPRAFEPEPVTSPDDIPF